MVALAGAILRDHARRVEGPRNAGRLNREGELERVRFLVGERLGQQTRAADARRLHPPERSALALAGHGDGLRCAAHRIEAVDVERQLHLLGLVEVIVDDHRDGDLIPLAQEARRAHAHDDVLAHQHPVDRRACLGVERDGVHRGPPGGERIRER